LLSGNATLSFLHEHPSHWPAWNMDWSDRQQPPVESVGSPAEITLVEAGPVRATFKIVREARGSKFTQWIQLAAGDAGKRVMVKNQVAWQSRGVSLKASFPLTVRNNMATYNLGLGTIERPTNEPKKYEVPSREWFDLTDVSGKYGVTILEDSKFGSDKPNDSTLRLTLLYTPITNAFHDQATQDWGIHDFTYGIYGHEGDWRTGLSEWQGKFVNQPLIAFQTIQHPGALGKVFSIATPDTTQVDIRALKKAESGEGIVVRVQELFGKPVDGVTVRFPADVLKVTEVNGQEQELGQFEPRKGNLSFDLSPFELKSFVVELRSARQIPGRDTLKTVSAKPLALLYDSDVVSPDSMRTDGNATSPSYPAELFPDKITLNGIPFILGGTAPYQRNALACAGQKIALPEGTNWNKVMILAAAASDTIGEFRIGKNRMPVEIQAFKGNIGQYDNRVWDQFGQVERIEPGFIKRDELALYTPHLHNDTSNIAYQYGYLFLYTFSIDPKTETIQLPENNAIKVFAITLVDQPWSDVVPTTPLGDDFQNRSIRDCLHGSQGQDFGYPQK
jgi:alpha-mannosidase